MKCFILGLVLLIPSLCLAAKYEILDADTYYQQGNAMLREYKEEDKPLKYSKALMYLYAARVMNDKALSKPENSERLKYLEMNIAELVRQIDKAFERQYETKAKSILGPGYSIHGTSLEVDPYLETLPEADRMLYLENQRKMNELQNNQLEIIERGMQLK